MVHGLKAEVDLGAATLTSMRPFFPSLPEHSPA